MYVILDIMSVKVEVCVFIGDKLEHIISIGLRFQGFIVGVARL